MVFEHQDPERVSRDRCFTARCLGGDRRVAMRIQFGLLDNALDYLRWATEHTTEDEDRHWKQALLNLAAGIELLLKARLQEEHWSLLFADIDKASARRLRTGDFVSVDARTALSRLEEIAGVKLSDEDRQPLRVLREFRNGAQHFALDVEEEAVKALLARNLNFAVDFCHDHLKDQLTEERERILAEILEAANAFSAFVDERREVIAGRLAAAPAVYDCPTCVQENTLVLGKATQNARSAVRDLSRTMSLILARCGCLGSVCLAEELQSSSFSITTTGESDSAASNLRAHSESEVGAPVVTGGPHAAAISESSERQRAAKSRRCSARGIESPRPRRQRKYCRNSSNAEQKRAADAKLPKPRIG